jgi:hypothetical protein
LLPHASLKSRWERTKWPQFATFCRSGSRTQPRSPNGRRMRLLRIARRLGPSEGAAAVDASRRLYGVNSGRVERRAGELSAGAALGADDASRVADAGCADQAADDGESAGHSDPDPEGVERGTVRGGRDRRCLTWRDARRTRPTAAFGRRQTWTITLPVLPPVNSRLSASGAFSSPSTRCSADWILPSASHWPICACASGSRSK